MLSLASVTAPTGMSVQEFARANEHYQSMRTDPVLIDRMEASNQVSVAHEHVYHGWEHARDVEELAQLHADQINQHKPVGWPGISQYDRIVAGASALLHDVGRSEPTKSRDELRYEHHRVGAKIAHDYMSGVAQRLWGDQTLLPDQFRRDVVWAVAHHGAHSWTYKDDEEKARRKREIQTNWMALLLIADKTSGSENRVPREKLDVMHHLAMLPVGDLRAKYHLDPEWTLARLMWGCEIPVGTRTLHDELLHKDARVHLASLGESDPKLRIDPHDHVNGAIKHRASYIVPDPEPGKEYWGTFVYQLKVDERIAPRKLVTGLDWWNDAFRVIAKAGKYLGERLLLEFNGRPLVYDENVHDWVLAPQLRPPSSC